MNVSAVSPPTPSNAERELDLPSFASDSAELAALLVETEDQNAQANQQELEQARSRVIGALEREYRALLDSANAALTGAIVNGSCTILGGAAGVWSTLDDAAAEAGKAAGEAGSKTFSEVMERTGNALTQLGAPLDTLIGQTSAIHLKAQAQRASQCGEDAKFDAQACVTESNQIDRRTEQALEFARAMAEAEARTAEAVLGNF